MAMNLGIGGPPKKKGVPPPPFGGGRGGLTAKPAAPPSGSAGGSGVMGAADDLGPPDAAAGVASKTPLPDGRGSTDAIAPEAVCYRSEMETCGSCEYNDGGQCSKLQIPVSDGDGCNLFKDRSGAAGPGAAEGMEDQGQGQSAATAI